MQPESYKEGLLLFSRYAFVCAKQEWGKDYIWLKKIVEQKSEPNGWLLEFRFPNACNSYRECSLCKENDYEPNFSLESVAYHWRNHHFHTGECDVKIATVLSVVKLTSSLILDCNGQKLYRPNIYLLDLKAGDKVYLHKELPIEKGN